MSSDYPLAKVDAPDGGDGGAQEDDDDALDADLQNGNRNDADLQSGQKLMLLMDIVRSLTKQKKHLQLTSTYFFPGAPNHLHNHHHHNYNNHRHHHCLGGLHGKKQADPARADL